MPAQTCQNPACGHAIGEHKSGGAFPGHTPRFGICLMPGCECRSFVQPPMAGGAPELDNDADTEREAAATIRRELDNPDGRRFAGVPEPEAASGEEATPFVVIDLVRDAVERADEVLAIIDAFPIANTKAAAVGRLEQRANVLERALDTIREAIA